MINKTFRYDIALLRAIAVLSVVFYHLKFPFFSSGFIGVDIFFVISGYLMTKIIISGIYKDSFDLIDFYKKRLVRIFPALLVMITIFSVILYAFLPIKLPNFFSNALPSTLFYSNIYYYWNSGYFENSSQENFLLHTWSLSVEWQFYMLFPIILILFKKIGFRNYKVLLGLITITSFFCMYYYFLNDRSFSFYMLPSRAWEMSLGGFGFLYEKQIREIPIKIRKVIVLCLYSVLLLVLFKIIDINGNSWPNKLTVIPAIATLGIILCQVDFNFFRSKSIKFIGDISYSWYLWHWPIYVFAAYLLPNYGLPYKIMLLILTFIFAVVSYYLVERNNFFLKPKIILAYTACLAIFTLFFSTTYKFDNKIEFYRTYKKDVLPNQFNINHQSSKSELIIDTNTINNIIQESQSILVLGDSHTGMFSNFLIKEGKAKGLNIVQISADATFPYPNAKSNFKYPERLMNWVFSSFIPNNKSKIDKVIISANYYGYSNQDLLDKLKSMDKYFKSLNLEFILIGQTPVYKFDYPVISSLSKYGLADIQFLEPRSIEVNELIKSYNYPYIDILNMPISKNDNTHSYIYDRDHLSLYGAEQYSRYISEQVFN